MKETLRGDRLEDSPMRNSSVGYKPTVPFRKIYGLFPPVFGYRQGGTFQRRFAADCLRIVRFFDGKAGAIDINFLLSGAIRRSP